MTTTESKATQLVRDYYASWQDGIASFDEPRLRDILAPDMLFEGPIAGTRTGVDSFMGGLRAFVQSMRGLRMIQLVESADGGAALYDCDLGSSSGTLRFAEFLGVAHGRITSIRLVYDPAEFRRLVS